MFYDLINRASSPWGRRLLAVFVLLIFFPVAFASIVGGIVLHTISFVRRLAIDIWTTVTTDVPQVVRDLANVISTGNEI
jgi:hypothetical protein